MYSEEEKSTVSAYCSLALLSRLSLNPEQEYRSHPLNWESKFSFLLRLCKLVFNSVKLNTAEAEESKFFTHLGELYAAGFYREPLDAIFQEQSTLLLKVTLSYDRL
jgi:hypothetical protein